MKHQPYHKPVRLNWRDRDFDRSPPPLRPANVLPILMWPPMWPILGMRIALDFASTLNNAIKAPSHDH